MLKKNLIIVTALLISVLVMAGGKTKNKEVFIQLYSVRDDINKDFKSTLDEIAKIGYTGVEAANYNNGKFYNLSPEEFKKEVESRGMQVLSSHINKGLNNNIAETDWNDVWNWWDTAIKAHKDAGMKYMVVPAMPLFKSLKDLRAYCDYYNQIGERCNKAGLRFGYHNHAFEFEKVENEIMYDYMLKNTDPDKVFFQMDVYWVVRGGKSPVDYFKKYPGRFLTLHIKDDKELGQSGMVGFDAIYNHANVAGTKYMIVEVEHYDYKPLESVKYSFDYLQKNAFVKKSYSK